MMPHLADRPVSGECGLVIRPALATVGIEEEFDLITAPVLVFSSDEDRAQPQRDFSGSQIELRNLRQALPGCPITRAVGRSHRAGVNSESGDGA